MIVFFVPSTESVRYHVPDTQFIFNYWGHTWSQVQIFSAVASYKKQTPWFNELIIVTHNLADDCGLPEH